MFSFNGKKNKQNKKKSKKAQKDEEYQTALVSFRLHIICAFWKF